jgi:acyl-CoA synthetase (AMP-forming)/AMP-acid ligase II
MLSGYASSEPAPLVHGHFLTGDIGMLDARGALTITGRLKLLIDVGGRKVNPAEVESVISSHPDVGSCVVVPIPVDQNVSRVKAILTPARPDIDVSVQNLRRFARERLSAYKVPRVFEVRATLPTSAIGKVLRHLVSS